MLKKDLSVIPDSVMRSNLLPYLVVNKNEDALVALSMTCKRMYELVSADPKLIDYAPILGELKKLRKLLSEIETFKKEIKLREESIPFAKNILLQNIKTTRAKEFEDLRQARENLERISMSLVDSGEIATHREISDFVKEIRNMPDGKYFRLNKKSLAAYALSVALVIFLVTASTQVYDSNAQYQYDQMKLSDNKTPSDDRESFSHDQDYQGNRLMGWSFGLAWGAIVTLILQLCLIPNYRQDYTGYRQTRKYLDCPVEYLTNAHALKLTYFKLKYRSDFVDKNLTKISDVANVLSSIYYKNLPMPTKEFIECRKLVSLIDTYIALNDTSYSQEFLPGLPRRDFYKNLNNFFVQSSKKGVNDKVQNVAITKPEKNDILLDIQEFSDDDYDSDDDEKALLLSLKK